MTNVFSKGYKRLTHNLDRRTIGILTILAVADLFVFSGILYLRYIIPQFHTYLGLSQSEFDLITSVYGIVSLVVYIPGGWLADRFSSRNLLVLALVITGLAGIWWVLTVQVNMEKSVRMTQLYIIYTIWGISTSALFWAPLWKLVSQNVPKEKQATAYGIQGTILGLMGVIVVSGGATAVTQVTQDLQDVHGVGAEITKTPFLILAYFIVGMVLVMALLAWKFIPNRKRGIGEQILNFKNTMKEIVKPMRYLRVWLAGVFVFGMYMFQSTFAYYMKDSLSILGISATVVTVLGGIRSYGLRFLMANPIGRWADKWRSYILGLVFILLTGFIICILFTFLPGWSVAWFSSQSDGVRIFMQVLMCVLFIVIGCIGWALVTLRFVQVGELPMEKNSYANTVGLISLVAFTPDAWFNYAASAIGKMEGNSIINAEGTSDYTLKGIQILLIIALGCVLLGLLCGWIVYLINRKEIRTLNKDSYRWRELGNV